MAESIQPFRNTRPALSLWTRSEPVPPPSATVVAAVLALGDVREACEDGKVSIRFSPERVAETGMTLLLGAERERGLDVTVIWDEAETKIVRVLDVAPLRAGYASLHQRNIYVEARKRHLARPALYPEQAAA
jgi:hypothetical protein